MSFIHFLPFFDQPIAMFARKFVLLFTSLLLFFPLFSQIRLPKLINDHMVLQRDQKIMLWGWAAPKEKLTISLGGKEYSARADKAGRWSVELPPMPAGGPLSLLIKGKKESKVISDILVGDVWVCSGQSNMEWILVNTNDAREDIAAANDSQIRHFKVPLTASSTPQDTLAGGNWEVASPETAGRFTAVGYYFARELRKAAGIPIGLINTSWGGSRIEPWMDAQSLGYMNPEELVKKLEAEEAAKTKELREQLIKKLGELPGTDQGMKNGQAIWQKAELDDAGWSSMKLPGLWEQAGLAQVDGIVWFRKTIELSAEQAAKTAVLGLAMIDDNDLTWVNGQEVGSTQQYNAVRRYEIPAKLLHPGKNVIVVRVDDTGGGGGIYGDPELMYLDLGGNKLPLAGDWRYKVGKVAMSATNFSPNQQPTKLYNFMIHPLLWYPIKGAIWYQGESNAGNVEQAELYADQFKTMISLWRQRWQVGDFPFFWVQLANFRQNPEQPANSGWASLRESQTAALELPNTGQAVIIDIGEANDIHPRNKKDVGYRLALAARQQVYGEKELVFSGPLYKSMQVEGNKIRLQFDHTGGGLEARRDKYGYLHGFAIAGADGKYVWAKALIEGKSVVVWSDAVKIPKSVRYAWSDNPDDANLYNKEGLPASPFQTH